MSCNAVICEYDPFHLGHEYLLSEMKVDGAAICLMSGSFTQRGLPAVLSKYERARLAACCGADLVLELPFPFSGARADVFARGGVVLLSALGVVDALYFGSECGDTARLTAAARQGESEDFEHKLAASLAAGHEVSYRHAYREAQGALGSNDSLACFYLSALGRSGSDIRPVAVKRMGAAFDGSGEGFASATAIRRALFEGDWQTVRDNVPSAVYDAVREAKNGGRIADPERLFPLFAAKLRTEGESALAGVPDMTAELCSRLCRGGLHARSMEELLSLAETKRYSRSRIRRCLLYMLLRVRAEDLAEPSFTTVLAANEKGRALLARIRRTATLDIITKPSDYKLCGEKTRRAFMLGGRADSVYELLSDQPRDGGAILREKPFML